jgi:D-serine deaminase-like pyridoxal phosphate-dependent protein
MTVLTDREFIELTAELPTPSLVIDLARVDRNIAGLAEYAASHRLRVRPHTKTHKSKFFAERQLSAGAGGLAAAKVGEAETMAEVCDDVLLAYPACDRSRAPRLAALAQRKTVRVAVDSVEALESLATSARQAGTTVGVLIDLDVGLHRTGVATPDDAWKLAQHADRTAGIRLDGLFCYPGQIWGTPESQAARLAVVDELLQQTLQLWQRSGLQAEVVSGGSTPTAYRSHHCSALTEIRPGTYLFNDRNTVFGGYCTWDDCAARVICTVVSTTVPHQFVIDAGAKTLGADRCVPASESGQGHVVEFPQGKITLLSEEHGQVDASACEHRPRWGDRVSIIPNHICPCVNLQNGFWIIDHEHRLQRLPVDSRGLLT